MHCPSPIKTSKSNIQSNLRITAIHLLNLKQFAMRKLYLLLFISVFFAGTLQTRAQYNGINLSYDGVDDIVTLPAGIVSGVTGDFTIEAYVLWRGTNNSFPRI